ncbi:MAG TPA: cell division protein SepF [Acidimicrobiales bacterium]|nr:cell division protein SepF [Acidimicrobiales bacterium]
MASMWRRAMLYLGLGPDDEYDDYEPMEDPAVGPVRPTAPAQSRYPASPPAPHDLPPEPEMSPSRSVRTIGTQPVRPQPVGDGGDPAARPRTAVVRPLQPVQTAKPHVVAPTSFNHAQEVADKLKVNLPVIVNLQNVDRDLSRRIIDFASGLCYGVGGQMERVANQVFLLTPSNVEVSAEERRRLQEHGYGEG